MDGSGRKRNASTQDSDDQDSLASPGHTPHVKKTKKNGADQSAEEAGSGMDIDAMAAEIEEQLQAGGSAPLAPADNNICEQSRTPTRPRGTPGDFQPVKSKKKPRTKYERAITASEPNLPKFKYPIILEDLGTKPSYASYTLSANILFQQAGVGQILGQRKSGRNFILDCVSAQQQKMITQLTELPSKDGHIKIRCRIPTTRTEGAIGPIPLMPEGELRQHLIRYNLRKGTKEPKLLAISRIKKRNGEASLTCRVSFACRSLPSSIQLGTSLFMVSPYRPQVMQCSKCHRIGHLASRCRAEARCPRCEEPAHDAGPAVCPLEMKQWRCVNCGGKGHSAKYGQCPQKKIFQAALELKSSNYMTVAEALAEVKKKQNGPSPTQTDSYHPQPVKRSSLHSFRHARISDSEDFPSLSAATDNPTKDLSNLNPQTRVPAVKPNNPDSKPENAILKALAALQTNFETRLEGICIKVEMLATKVEKMSEIQKERDNKIQSLLKSARTNASNHELPTSAFERLTADLLERVHRGDPVELSEFVYSLLNPAQKVSLTRAPPLSAELAAALECLKPNELNSF